jgi:rhodanese-related sulfurtransferase
LPTIDVTAVADDDYLLDVRESDEWSAGHAPQAAHLPLGQLVARLDEVPTDRQVAVICRGGGRSAQATEYLNQVGRRAVNVAGGMQAWAAAGRPMTSEGGAPPVVA